MIETPEAEEEPKPTGRGPLSTVRKGSVCSTKPTQSHDKGHRSTWLSTSHGRKCMYADQFTLGEYDCHTNWIQDF